MIKKIISVLSIVAVIFGTIAYKPLTATAAQLTGVKDTMTSQQTSATSNHTFTWTLVSSATLSAGDTVAIGIQANATDFTVNAAGSWQTSDFALTDTNHAATAPLAVGAAPSCTATDNYTVTVAPTSLTTTFLITTCSAWVASAANASITFLINGTTAVGTGTITNKSSNVASSVFTITNTGSNTHSATGALAVEDDSIVNVTATVAPTLTFTNDDSTIGFGTLTSGAARYANSAATGSAGRVTAHTLAIGTNATSGYTLTYNGATLTRGANTIAVGSSLGATGTPGTSQFAMGGTETGSGAMGATYDAATPLFTFVAGATTNLATSSAVTASSSIAMEYIANISTAQQAGNYSTDITYIATGNF